VTLPSLAGPAFADNVTESDGPPALFLDVDGTLLDLAERPDAVVTPAGLVSALARAERNLGGALALISGRSLEDLDRLFNPLRLRASGVHGAQLRFDPSAPAINSRGAVELPPSLWTRLIRTLAAFPGTFAENKRFSFAVHYRLAIAVEAPLREAIERLVESEPQIGIEVMNAHYAIELKAPGCDKGQAIASFLAVPPFRGRTPIFVGDDETDETGFAVVSSHGGFAYSVGWRRPGAIGVFERPSEVRDWLAGLARGDAR
jgi:trehalose 6-phosphate phosphatase